MATVVKKHLSSYHNGNAAGARGGTRGLTFIAVILVAALAVLPVQWFVLLSSCRRSITEGFGLSWQDTHAGPLKVACEMRAPALEGQQGPITETISVGLAPDVAAALGLVAALALTLYLRQRRRRGNPRADGQERLSQAD